MLKLGTHASTDIAALVFAVAVVSRMYKSS